MSTPLQEGRRKALFLGLSAVLVAGGTAWVAWSVVDRYQDEVEQARQPSGQVELVVARQELPPGQPISAADLELVGAPEELALSERTFADVDEVKGKIPGERILAGEIVNRGRLLEGGAIMHVDAAIAPGTRAVTVKIDRAAGVGGMLRPGFFVDVIVTIRPDTKDLDANWVTETILQGVRVVAVDEWLQGNPEEQEEARQQGRPRHVDVTLEVDPLEAEKLALASARGELVLSLRHAEDDALLEHEGPLVTNALVGISSARKATSRRTRRSRVAPEPETTKAEVIEGSGVKVEEFDESGKRVHKGKGR